MDHWVGLWRRGGAARRRRYDAAAAAADARRPISIVVPLGLAPRGGARRLSRGRGRRRDVRQGVVAVGGGAGGGGAGGGVAAEGGGAGGVAGRGDGQAVLEGGQRLPLQRVQLRQ